MNTGKLYARIALLVDAVSNCAALGKTEWQATYEASLRALEEFLPSGSGVDCGTKIDLDASLRRPGKIALTLSYHHMNEDGFYDGWTEHAVTVCPSLTSGFVLTISGRDRNGIKEYLHELLADSLHQEIAQEENGDYFSPALRESAARFKADVAAGRIT
jgi:hypothetical protein